jgi:ClpP class serine protease
VQALMGELHERFKGWVRARRAGRLKAEESALFDGGWMLGERAVAMGLIDRLGDIEQVVAELGGKRARPRVFKPRRRGLGGLLPRLIGSAVVEAVEIALDEQRARMRPRL